MLFDRPFTPTIMLGCENILISIRNLFHSYDVNYGVLNKKSRASFRQREILFKFQCFRKTLAYFTALSKAFGVVSLRYASASLAACTSAPKASASWIAISDNTLRSTSMPALFKPSMKRP